MRILTTIVNSRFWQSCPTHVWERLFVASYLILVAWFTSDISPVVAAWDGSPGEIFQAARPFLANICGAFAVFSSLEYMLIALRLEEAQEKAETPVVDCYRKLRRLVVRREVLWVLTFALLGAWTSMAGVPLALGTIPWRILYKRARGNSSMA